MQRFNNIIIFITHTSAPYNKMGANIASNNCNNISIGKLKEALHKTKNVALLACYTSLALFLCKVPFLENTKY